jgi:hypothetical protein
MSLKHFVCVQLSLMQMLHMFNLSFKSRRLMVEVDGAHIVGVNHKKQEVIL